MPISKANTYPARFAFLAAVALSASACTGQTEGDKGVLSFAYPWCAFGCPTTEPMLKDATIALNVTGGALDGSETASLADPSVANIASSKTTCTCERIDEKPPLWRPIGTLASCTKDVERKACSIAITLNASGSGTTKLSILRDTELVDQTTLEVAPAARIEVEVSVSEITTSESGFSSTRKTIEAVNGVYLVPVMSDIHFAANAFDSAGRSLRYQEGAVSASETGSETKRFLDKNGEVSIFWPDAGESEVTISANNASKTIKVRRQ